MEFAMEHPWKLCTAAVGAIAAGAMYLHKRQGPAPEYASDDAWFARESSGSKLCDVFYAHPTTDAGLFRWNMEPIRGHCTGLLGGDPDLTRGQAGAWTESCNLWAPRYRQMGFLSQAVNLSTANEAKRAQVQECIDRAYGDLKHAFVAFLEQRPDKQRPFMVAAHSQGAILMTKVISQCVQDTVHEAAFVAAYLAGGYVPADLFGSVYRSIHACTGPEDTGCVISYDTRTAVFKPESLNNLGLGLGLYAHHLHWLLHDKYCEEPQGTDDVNKARLQINPATWTAAGGGRHLGVNTSFQQKTATGVSEPTLPPEGYGEQTTVSGKAVIVADPEIWLPGAGSKGGPGNMHPIDVHFWFFNIKQNVAQRLAAWIRKNK